MSAVTETTIPIATVLLRRVALIGGAVLLSLVSTGLACFWWQSRTIDRLRADNEIIASDRDRAVDANQATAMAMEHYRKEAALTDAAISFKQREVEALRAEMSALQQCAQEVATREAYRDRRIAPDDADILRMQYQTANRYTVRVDPGGSATVPVGRTPDTVAAWSERR